MSTEIVTRLNVLKLHGMAANWPEVAAHCRHAALEPEALLTQLLDAEGAERTVRSIAYQMTAARFPAHRDLAGFDFASATADEALVRQLHTTAFTEAAHNVVLIGRHERTGTLIPAPIWFRFAEPKTNVREMKISADQYDSVLTLLCFPRGASLWPPYHSNDYRSPPSAERTALLAPNRSEDPVAAFSMCLGGPDADNVCRVANTHGLASRGDLGSAAVFTVTTVGRSA